MTNTTVTGLYIYPVKSMQGITLEQAQLTPKGLLNDRRWMVVRSNGRFVTQRELPRLALVHTSLDENGVRLFMQDHGSISIPFQGQDGDLIETRVWGDTCQTLDQGGEISGWLAQALGSDDPLAAGQNGSGIQAPAKPPGKSG